MRWQTVKSFSAKIGNEHQTFHPGDTVDLANDKATKLLLAGVIAPTDLEGQKHEYSMLLASYWQLDEDPDVTREEAFRLVGRLDELYRLLHRQGHTVPIRLPTERRARAEPDNPGHRAGAH